MKTKKTPTAKRTEYIYNYVDTDGKEREEHITVGENGVTAKHIAVLHSLDDKEIYNNAKNRKISLTESEEETFEDKELFYFDEKTLTDLKKCGCNGLQSNAAYFDDMSSEVERLRELAATLSAFDRKIYELVLIKGMTSTEAARILGAADRTVRYHAEKIRKYIKNNF